MKIIEQSHEILHMDGLDLIERAGRTCYKSEDKIGCVLTKEGYGNDGHPCPEWPGDWPCSNAGCGYQSAPKFVRMLIKRGHHAMLEHAGASVKFITNRGVTHELVRHRLCAFGQESTRYVNYGGKDMEFIRPVWCVEGILGSYQQKDDFMENPDKPEFSQAERLFMESCFDSEWAYDALLDEGWRPEQAREVLPNSLKTEIVVTCNYREWRHIMKLRAIGTTGKPHPQMQALMMPLLVEFREKLPAMFGDLEVPDA